MRTDQPTECPEPLQNTKYVKIVYDMLVSDFISFPNKISWVRLLHDLIGELGFMEAWIQQNVGNEHVFFLLSSNVLRYLCSKLEF